MKKTAIAVPILFVLTLMPLANFAIAADDEDQQVLAKDLKALEVPGKVVAVLWTVRPERCTLQVVFPNAGRIPQPMANRPKLVQPTIQAWLLTADGSAIASTGRAEPGAKNIRQPLGVEVLFGFPRSADAEAVAVALRVDDVFLIERLPPRANATGAT
jgi:hypothetical protein